MVLAFAFAPFSLDFQSTVKFSLNVPECIIRGYTTPNLQGGISCILEGFEENVTNMIVHIHCALCPISGLQPWTIPLLLQIALGTCTVPSPILLHPLPALLLKKRPMGAQPTGEQLIGSTRASIYCILVLRVQAVINVSMYMYI